MSPLPRVTLHISKRLQTDLRWNIYSSFTRNPIRGNQYEDTGSDMRRVQKTKKKSQPITSYPRRQPENDVIKLVGGEVRQSGKKEPKPKKPHMKGKETKATKGKTWRGEYRKIETGGDQRQEPPTEKETEGSRGEEEQRSRGRKGKKGKKQKKKREKHSDDDEWKEKKTENKFVFIQLRAWAPRWS